MKQFKTDLKCQRWDTLMQKQKFWSLIKICYSYDWCHIELNSFFLIMYTDQSLNKYSVSLYLKVLQTWKDHWFYYSVVLKLIGFLIWVKWISLFQSTSFPQNLTTLFNNINTINWFICLCFKPHFMSHYFHSQ